MKAYLRNPYTGAKAERKRGWSWTTFFFGIFVPLFRADWKFVGIWVLVLPFSFITFGIVGIIWGIIASIKYNDWHINDLRNKGYIEISQSEFYGIV